MIAIKRGAMYKNNDEAIDCCTVLYVGIMCLKPKYLLAGKSCSAIDCLEQTFRAA